MSRSRRPWTFVAVGRVALLPPAAFAVHQLRYMLAYGGHAGVMLERTGHSYLHSVVPWIMLVVTLVLGGFLVALGKAFAGHNTAARYTRSLLGMWLACTACLIAIFSGQEFLEGLFAIGHPAGLAGIFGYGGWWAIPVAAVIGLLLAAIMHGALWVLREVAARHARRAAVWSGPAVTLPHPAVFLLLLRPPLVGGWSGRGPPV